MMTTRIIKEEYVDDSPIVSQLLDQASEEGHDNEKDNGTGDVEHDISELDTIKIPPEQIPPALVFHPGCRVVFIKFGAARDIPSVVVYGTILYAAVNLKSRRRSFVYKVLSQADGNEFLAHERALHFAQATPVSVTIPGGIDVDGTVFSSQLLANGEEARYTITTGTSSPGVAPTKTVLRDVPARHVRYRVLSSEKTSAPEADAADVRIESVKNRAHDADDRCDHGANNPSVARVSLGFESVRRILIPSDANYETIKAKIVDAINMTPKLSDDQLFQMEWKNQIKLTHQYAVELRGSAELIEVATKVIEMTLATSADEAAAGLMHYENAMLNKHYGEVNSEAVKTWIPPSFQRKAWLAAIRLRADHDHVMGLFIGRNGAGIRSIQTSTGCKLSIVDCSISHFLITGSAASSVNGALRQVRDRLDWALSQGSGCNGERTLGSPSDRAANNGNVSKRAFRELRETDNMNVSRSESPKRLMPSRVYSENDSNKRPRFDASVTSRPVTTRKIALRIPWYTDTAKLRSELYDGHLCKRARDLNTSVTYRHVDNDRQVIVELVGDDIKGLQEVALAIKYEVVKLAEEGDRSRAAFDFALHNETDTVSKGACLLPTPLFDKSHWVWAMTMPENGSVVARFIGRQHSARLDMERQSNCSIEMVRKKTRDAHILVTGKHPAVVAKGRYMVERKIKELKAKATEW